jgi:hypothetical protein
VLASESTALTAGGTAVFLLPASVACGAGLARPFGAGTAFDAAAILVAPATFAAGMTAGTFAVSVAVLALPAALAGVFGAALGAGAAAFLAAGLTGAVTGPALARLLAGTVAGLDLAGFATGVAARFAAGLALALSAAAFGVDAALAAVFAVLVGATRAFGFALAAGDNVPAVLLAGAAPAVLIAPPALRDAAPAAGLLVFLADLVTVSFILPSRCLPLAVMAFWQFSRQTKAMRESPARQS